ncbi:tail fiber protein [Bacteriophage Eos]|nr:tail fiber protein [Bacteriophage Eos]
MANRNLMPKSGAMAPYIVVNRDAAVAGVFSVDGMLGAVDLTTKYVQITAYNQKIGTIEERISTNEGDIVLINQSITSINTAIQGINTSLSNKANKGANSDITSLSGLTTALSVSQGGTGGKTVAEAKMNLELERFLQASNWTQLFSPRADGIAGRGDYAFTVTPSGEWGLRTNSNGVWKALEIGKGGTGALTADDGRTNLGAVGKSASGWEQGPISRKNSIKDGSNVSNISTIFGSGTATPTTGTPPDSGNAILTLINMPVYNNANAIMAYHRDGVWVGQFDPSAETPAPGWRRLMHQGDFGIGTNIIPTWNQTGNPENGIYNTLLSNTVWGQTGSVTLHMGQGSNWGADICMPAGGNPGIAVRTYNGSGSGNKWIKMMHAETGTSNILTNDANTLQEPGLAPGLVQHTASNNMPTTATNNYNYLQVMSRGLANNDAFQQFAMPYATQTDAGRMFFRGWNTNSWSPWKEVSTIAVSDERLKNILGDSPTKDSRDNIEQMEFKQFAFKNDEEQRLRRGVISQQIVNIDPEYVKEIGGYLHLDETPLLLDALAAIKDLSIENKKQKAQIGTLELKVAALEKAVAQLISLNELR